MTVKVYTINAFARTAPGGNPAGVVLNADALADCDMIKLARTLSLSETAFVMTSDMADYKIRFFTPSEEVGLCGHATIGAFAVLSKEGFIVPGGYTQETKAGILHVEVSDDSVILMEQPKPRFYEFPDKEAIAASLNVSAGDLCDDLPVQIVFTGLKDILVPVRSLEILNRIKPGFGAVSEISKIYDAVGYHVFTLDTIYPENDAHCRNFAPLYGIPEEAATGTSNGALACYLYKYGVVKKSRLIFEQGYAMALPSEILVALKMENNEIAAVEVGGRAVNLKVLDLELQ